KFDVATAKETVRLSLEVLQKLIENANIWQSLPISERSQHASDIYLAIEHLAELSNTKQLTNYISQNQVKFMTTSFVVVNGGNMELHFDEEFSFRIPFDGLGFQPGETIFLSVALIRDLFPYLSYDYKMNSQILTVMIE